MTEFEEKMLQAISGINSRLDSMEKRFDSRLDSMEKRFDGMDSRLDGMDSRLDGMDKRFDGIDNMLDVLEKDMSDVKGDIKAINITLETEVAPVLKMLLEYQLSNSKRLINLEKNVELMRDEIDINEVLNKLT